MNTEITTLIKDHFPLLSEPDLQKKIASVGTIWNFKEGEVIMNFGSYVKAVPLLVKGSIKVVREDEEDGKELLLYFLKAGETCSMSFSCCMMDKRSDIRTTAEDDSTLIAIPIKYVNDWMSLYPSWRNFVMRSYDNRMQILVKTLDNIAFKKMDERLWDYLIKRSEAHNSKTIHSTHHEIANDLNASREAVSRLLKQLEKKGVLILERNKIRLL
jgi:cAMP-binding proteins - catabolite gene activator and regulatory subunit of cAMP-dependent protein kinases